MSAKRTKHQSKQHQHESGELTPRQLWQRLGIATCVALVLAVALVFGINRVHRLTDEERGVLASYETIRAALANDDLALAQTAATKMAQTFHDREPTAVPAQQLAASATLHDARLAFKELSQDALRLARGQPDYHIARCPGKDCAAKCNGCPMSEFSAWVQVSTTVENPFMGRAHSDCGVVSQ